MGSSFEERLSNDLIVIDDFFENPNGIRNLALNHKYVSHREAGEVGWRGHRGEITKETNPKLFDKLYQALKKELGFISKFSFYFHYCLESDKLDCFPSFDEKKFHKDTNNNWAGVIYLTPNADKKAGTILSSDDKTEYKLVENIFNRLVLYSSDILHAPADLFGTNINDGRMTLTIFIDNKLNIRYN